MANSLFVELGFNTNKQSITGTVSGIGKITSALDGLRRSATALSLNVGLKSIASGLSSIAASAKKAFTQSYGFVEEFAKAGDKVAKTSRLV